MQKTFFIFFILILIVTSSAIFAFGDPFTYLNYLEDMKTAINSATSLANQAQQINNQIQNIRYQAQNSGHLSNYQFNRITQLMQQMDQVTNQGQSISYNASNIDRQFRALYPDYVSHQNPQNYQESYSNWNATTLNTINNTMQSDGMAAGNFQHESALMNQLRTQGQTATGRMQVMQVSTEIASENVNQLQELKRITLSQDNAQNAYMAYRVSKNSYVDKSLADLESHTHSTFPPYQNNAAFGQLPQG